MMQSRWGSDPSPICQTHKHLHQQTAFNITGKEERGMHKNLDTRNTGVAQMPDVSTNLGFHKQTAIPA
jgi:hypothetical protein